MALTTGSLVSPFATFLDLDRDGDLDVATGSSSGTRIYLLENVAGN